MGKTPRKTDLKAKPRASADAAPARVAAKPAIVAVGASAGGLEAFTELLGALPVDVGLALVLIQHLQAGHPSYLTRLLQKATHLQVDDIADGVVPQANHVYVLPAGREATIEKGRLRLHTREDTGEPPAPIDRFMRALAAERKSGAIGVVLSGTASDGTQGLLAIKSEGGLCFAQAESSAEYGGMAHSAIASGCVDFVLPPAEIARELARVAHHPYLASGAKAISPISEGDRAYRAILELLRQQTGMDFTQYRSSTIGRRIARRMAVRTLDRLGDYLGYLRGNRAEVSALLEDLLIPATRFFRDPEVFEVLQRKVLAPLAKGRRPANRPLRLWSVGCSTGEEAYSLAIVAMEALGASGEGGGTLQVFGTDINETGIRRARAGRYSAEIEKDVPPERLRRYFVKTEQGYRVSKALRDACIFAQHNVLREAPFSRLDVICCRNVMIYMEPALQRRIFPVLHYALNPGGALVLGSAESASPVPELFKQMGHDPAGRKLKIYTKLAAAAPQHFEVGTYRALSRAAPIALAPKEKSAAAGAGAADEAGNESDRIVLDKFAPAGVIVDADLNVIEFRGHTSPFLEPAPGAASLNLLKLTRGELSAYVCATVLKARKGGEAVSQAAWIAEQGDKSEREVTVHAIPLTARGAGLHGDGGGGKPLFLVLFQPGAESPAGGRPAGQQNQREMERLRRSLADSQKLVRSLSDDYQAAKQEFQAASEEIASANEELQSSNEELETSKEELQSANEEISTINEELRHRNTELHQANTDLQSLISAADIAVVLLDRELRIRRFSPAAAKLLNLIPADVGRRLSDIRSGLAIAGLDALAVAAVASGEAQRREAADGAGRRLELRVNPYIAADNQTEGVVMSLASFDGASPSAQGTHLDAGRLAEAIVSAATNPVALLRPDLSVLCASPSFQSARAGLKAAELRPVAERARREGEAPFFLDVEGNRRPGRLVQIAEGGAEGALLLLELTPPGDTERSTSPPARGSSS